jgi:peptide/nickel transport system substrate-binding protein
MSDRDTAHVELLRQFLHWPASRRELLRGSTAAMGGAMIGLSDLPSSRLVRAQEGNQGGTLTVAFEADPEVLDPHITTALLAARVIALMHDNLVNRDYDGSIKPGLAEAWEVSEDGLTYTFTLKEGVKFHSGKEFSSEDVKFTFERWLSLEGSPTSYTIEPVDTIETPDPLTVVFTLKQPYNILLDQLAGSWSVILNQAAIEEAGENYGVSVVDGTGPFKFVSWNRNQQITLERYEEYTWGGPIFQNPGPAYVDGIEIVIIPEASTRVAEFQAGNLHLVPDVPAQDVARLSQAPGVSIVEYEQLQTTYLGMNTTKAPTDDVKVRQAVAYALNREEIVEGANFGLGLPARTMLHPDTPFYWENADEVAPTYDPDKAATLLEEAGWLLGSDGVREKDTAPLVLPLWVINDTTTVLQAQIIEQQLAEVGIRVETTQYEQTAWFEAARSGEQVGYIIGVFYDIADILYFYFYSEQIPAPNRFFYEVPEVDEWLVDARTNTDLEVVRENYYNVQERLIEDAPAAPFIHTLGTLGVAEGVEGVEVHPSRWLYRMLDISLASS